ncbi:eCIS core domain-containing protein [Streptomyces gardneri]|uniref:eCIS core domain-containing protein n=1 Tax=Streptomyces gardneri TaxID=66892 RepID=UPI0033F1A03F
MHAKDAPKPSTATRAEAGARRDGPLGGTVTPTTGVGGVLSPQTVLALQRTIGNAAVSRLVEESRHQHGAGCGHAQSPEAAPAPVQRSAVHGVLRSSGSPLDDGTRADMESRLGADFSDVRVHNDSAARASAAEVGARAYTSGNHIVIGDGGGDRHTLAHELTHVIQQRQGPVSGTDNGSGLRVSDPSDRFEREAEANARRALSGSAPAPAPGAGAVAEPVQRTAGGTRSSAPSVQRVQTDPEQTTSSSSSSSSAPPAQETAVATAPAYGTEISTAEEATAHGLNAVNTLVVNAGHSGDMYHVRAAMLLDPGLKLLMYGLLDDFDEVADVNRISGSVRSRLMADEIEPRATRTAEFKATKTRLQRGSGDRTPPEGMTDAKAIKQWRKAQVDADIAVEQARLGAHETDLEERIGATTAGNITRERDNRPRAKRAIARKALHMYQLHEDLGPNRVFFTKKSGESLGLAHGGGENLSTNKFRSGMPGLNIAGREERMQEFYRDYAAPDQATEQAFNDARTTAGHPLGRFRTGVRYVIVNYRDSGHTGEGNAPALDTGRSGLAQLQEMISNHPDLGGARPVLIGGYPDPATVDGPHLLKYWEWPGMTGRRSELALLHYLKENFTIIGAVGMRSGVTDQFAFAGIKTLSIDISPNQARPKSGQTEDNETDVEKYPSKGWERGGKLEAILGPQYGRAFLREAREDDQKVLDRPWEGPFGERDRAMLRDAIAYFFAEARSDGGALATAEDFRHSSHPLHQASLDELERSTTLGEAKKAVIRARIAAQQA